MGLFTYMKNSLLATKRHFRTNSLESLLWLVNAVPRAAGFSIQGDKIKAPFWFLHIPLLVYVYGVGCFVYQWKYAENAGDVIRNYFNISLLILVSINSWWYLWERPLLKAILKDINNSDRMSRSSSIFEVQHEKMMKTIKNIIFIFYGSSLADAAFIYLPDRVDILGHHATLTMTPCVGLAPLTSSPCREVCLTLIIIQEFTIMTVTLNFQALLLLLIAHTAAMYRILSYEIMELNENGDIEEKKALAKELLPLIARRHSLILDVVEKLQSLYSIPMGTNIATNAVCISLFCYMPLHDWLQFAPLVVYCILVFFLYCFLYQRVINTSEEFERAVYCCGWENFELEEQKLVYVMLRQAQKPIQLLAANIIPVNIYTFGSTLQAIYKFVTVIKF